MTARSILSRIILNNAIMHVAACPLVPSPPSAADTASIVSVRSLEDSNPADEWQRGVLRGSCDLEVLVQALLLFGQQLLFQGTPTGLVCSGLLDLFLLGAGSSGSCSQAEGQDEKVSNECISYNSLDGRAIRMYHYALLSVPKQPCVHCIDTACNSEEFLLGKSRSKWEKAASLTQGGSLHESKKL
jgi:hypothetical protein